MNRNIRFDIDISIVTFKASSHATCLHTNYRIFTSGEEPNEVLILRARAHSNRSIARRNLLGVGDSLGEDYVGIIGDGTFVPSQAEYLGLFKEGFDRPKQSMTYVRTSEVVNIADDQNIAAEHGRWIATLPSGSVAYTGIYAAMWRRTPTGWKIRTEIFVHQGDYTRSMSEPMVAMSLDSQASLAAMASSVTSGAER